METTPSPKLSLMLTHPPTRSWNRAGFEEGSQPPVCFLAKNLVGRKGYDPYRESNVEGIAELDKTKQRLDAGDGRARSCRCPRGVGGCVAASVQWCGGVDGGDFGISDEIGGDVVCWWRLWRWCGWSIPQRATNERCPLLE